MRVSWLILFLISTTYPAQAEEFFGEAITVLDGDTILVTRGNNSPIKVRLADIDAPEKAQDYGAESKESLLKMVLHQQVKISSKAVDDYGRLVADIHVGELNVNREQVRRGMAWNFSRFRSSRELADLQREAQQAKRGLWAEKSAIEPSKWRKQHPSVWPVPSVAPLPNPVVSNSALKSSSALNSNSAQACSKTRCAQMSSCEEAKRYLTECGIQTIDGDKDGVPCEKLCIPSAHPEQKLKLDTSNNRVTDR